MVLEVNHARGFMRLQRHLETLQRQRKSHTASLDERFLPSPAIEEPGITRRTGERGVPRVFTWCEEALCQPIGVGQASHPLHINSDWTVEGHRDESETIGMRQIEMRRK